MPDPIVTATHEVMAGLLPILDDARDAGDGPHGTSPPHMAALLREAMSRPDLPADKVSRWLGFVQGVTAARGIVSPEEFRITGGVPQDDAVASATRILMADLHLMLAGTRDDGDEAPGTAPSHLASVMEGVLTARSGTVRELSVLLGFVQGVMTVRGMITVDGERDRTRPIFHAAYAAQGRAIPPTVAVSGDNGRAA